jgi:hypothetical protein
MAEESVREDGRIIYRGYITHLFRDCNVPVPNFGEVLSLLKRMQCITQLKRGGGGAMSEWLLSGTIPTLEAFSKVYGELAAQSSVRISKVGMLEQQMDDVRQNIGGVNIPRALADLQSQINTLREEVRHEVRGSESGGRTEHEGGSPGEGLLPDPEVIHGDGDGDGDAGQDWDPAVAHGA